MKGGAPGRLAQLPPRPKSGAKGGCRPCDQPHFFMGDTPTTKVDHGLLVADYPIKDWNTGKPKPLVAKVGEQYIVTGTFAINSIRRLRRLGRPHHPQEAPGRLGQGARRRERGAPARRPGDQARGQAGREGRRRPHRRRKRRQEVEREGLCPSHRPTPFSSPWGGRRRARAGVPGRWRPGRAPFASLASGSRCRARAQASEIVAGRRRDREGELVVQLREAAGEEGEGVAGNLGVAGGLDVELKRYLSFPGAGPWW